MLENFFCILRFTYFDIFLEDICFSSCFKSLKVCDAIYLYLYINSYIGGLIAIHRVMVSLSVSSSLVSRTVDDSFRSNPKRIKVKRHKEVHDSVYMTVRTSSTGGTDNLLLAFSIDDNRTRA